MTSQQSNEIPAPIQAPRHIAGRQQRRLPLRSGALCFGAGLVAAAALSMCTGEDGNRNEQEVTEVKQGITSYDASLETNVGSLATHQIMKMNVNYDARKKIPLTDMKFGRVHTTTYEGEFPADVKLCFRGMGLASTTRTDKTAPPLPSDKVEIEVDRAGLMACRGRLNLLIEPEVTTVANGYAVKRNGKPVIEPERVFLEDGEHTSGKFKLPPGDTPWDDIMETALLGTADIGEDAIRNMLIVAQALARDPKCLKVAFDTVSPEQLIETAIKDYYVLQGFSRENVIPTYKEGSEWPTTDEMKDEDGFTFREIINQIESKLPGNQSINTASTCQPGSLSDTANAPQQFRSISAKGGN